MHIGWMKNIVFNTDRLKPESDEDCWKLIKMKQRRAKKWHKYLTIDCNMTNPVTNTNINSGLSLESVTETFPDPYI
jgi:hypothetical protein